MHEEMDVNRDGLISAKELRHFFVTKFDTFIKPNDIDALIAQFDTDRVIKIILFKFKLIRY